VLKSAQPNVKTAGQRASCRPSRRSWEAAEQVIAANPAVLPGVRANRAASVMLRQWSLTASDRLLAIVLLLHMLGFDEGLG